MRRGVLTVVLCVAWCASAAAAPGGRRLLDAVERLRGDPRWQGRMEAAVALGSSEDPRALKPLMSALDDDHFAVRAAAVRALVRLGDARAVPALLDRAADHEPFVRTEARKAAVQFELERAKPYLVNALRRHPDARVRLLACERLAEHLDADTAEVLLDATSDREPVGRYALAALASLPPAQAQQAFLRGLEHQDYLVQVASISALADSGTPEVTEALVRMLDAQVPEVMVAATEAVRRLRGHVDAQRYRVLALRAKERFERARALKVLGILGDEESRRILLGALDDPDLVVRSAAVSALAGLGELRALPRLEQMRGMEENARILSSLKIALAQLRRLRDAAEPEAPTAQVP